MTQNFVAYIFAYGLEIDRIQVEKLYIRKDDLDSLQNNSTDVSPFNSKKTKLFGAKIVIDNNLEHGVIAVENTKEGRKCFSIAYSMWKDDDPEYEFGKVEGRDVIEKTINNGKKS